MDKPYCRLCGHRHWAGEDHAWGSEAATAVPNKAVPNNNPVPNSANVARAAKWKAANQDRYRDYMRELMRERRAARRAAA
jgi:hypothetical protein